jgi:hypothetical protein
MNHFTRYVLGLAAGCLIPAAAFAQGPGLGGPNPYLRPTTQQIYNPGRMQPMYTSGRVTPLTPAMVNPVYNPGRVAPLTPLTPSVVNPGYNPSQPIGSDWWKIYPWSPYNAYRNPYWYPPYNTNYPYPPNQAYPYPYPYPMPQPYPAPSPWGGRL